MLAWICKPCFFIDGLRPNFSQSKVYKGRNSLLSLSKALNLSDYNKHLENWIKYEWKQLFTSSDLEVIATLLKNGAVTKATFAPIDKGCKGRPNKCSINSGDHKNSIKETNKEASKLEPLPEMRFCASCGRNISVQRKASRYCSAKYVGVEQAKKCRNKGRIR